MLLVYLWTLSLLLSATCLAETVDSPEPGSPGQYVRQGQIPFARKELPDPCTPSSSLPPTTFKHFAQYSPWFPTGQYTPPHETCQIDQVSILHRHASRFPTAGAGRIIEACITRIKSAIARKPHSRLSWILDYSYNLGADDLVGLGEDESKASARCAHQRYSSLAGQKGAYVRSSSCKRVVDTAIHWSTELAASSNGSVDVPPILVISDAVTSNDTLANTGCPLHKAKHTHWEWANVFTSPIATRLGLDMEGYEVSALDVIILMSLCAFQSAADRRESRFCTLFTEEEIRYYEYFNDLEKFYNTGDGNPLGPVLGVGYTSELLARLTDRQVEDCTQTNSTLDGSEETFPLGKGVYADFSHDNTMAAIVSAMGLFEASASDMPLDHINKERAWKFGHIAPFAGRIVFERLACIDGIKRVRAFANDALLSMPMCKADVDGMCTLDDFVTSQHFARVGGQKKWKECFPRDW